MLIKATVNGPYIVTGPAKVEDAESQIKELKEGEKIALCRCGASKNKPWCDGTHAKIDFKASK